MKKNYNTTLENRPTSSSTKNRLYSKIRKALTLDEIKQKYSDNIRINKAIA